MTQVEVCDECKTLFEEGEDHCRRCGADRASVSVLCELRDLCFTYTGDKPESDEMVREVKPIFEPRWGKVQWYELPEEERKAQKAKKDKEDP